MTDLATLREILDEAELKYYCDDENEVLFLPYTHVTVRVHVVENGEALVFYGRDLLTLNEAREHREDLLFVMAALHYRLKIGTYDVDPEDGSIGVSHCLALEDAEMTRTQFRRVLRGMVHAAETYGPLLRYVAYHGRQGLSIDELMARVESDDEPGDGPDDGPSLAGLPDLFSGGRPDISQLRELLGDDDDDDDDDDHDDEDYFADADDPDPDPDG